MYQRIVRERNWTREQINNMSLRELKVYFMESGDVEEIGRMPRSKAGRKLIQPKIDAAIANLMEGRRWDSVRDDGA